MDAEKENSGKRNGGGACRLKPEVFSDNEELRVDGGEIFQPGGDFGYFVGRKREGNYPIKGIKGRKS